MKNHAFFSRQRLIVILVAAIMMMMMNVVSAFLPISSSSRTMIGIRTNNEVIPSNTALFFFGGPKDDGSPGDYVCPDCGYVFTKGPKAWAELPDSWYCPPCGAPKRRFKKVPKGSASGKVQVKKSWFDK